MDGGVAKGEEGLGSAGPQRRSPRTPEGLPVVRTDSGERGERRAERLDGGAQMEAKESDISHGARTVAIEKLGLVNRELKEKKTNYQYCR